jgi:hypothetical protein
VFSPVVSAEPSEPVVGPTSPQVIGHAFPVVWSRPFDPNMV